MNEVREKDEHRYSYSRLRCFKECPRKHHYIYHEKIQTPDNEFTLSGRMFHHCVELILKGEDDKVEEVYQEFEDYCRNGIIRQEPDLLRYVVDEYFRYYGTKYLMENTLFVEEEFTSQITEDDYLIMINDQTFEENGMVGVRDIKTTLNSLKYSHDDVKLNEQLLLYTPFIEERLNRKVDFIEIDEVRLAKLKEVPLLKNGKPSTDKKALGLVPYEDYYNELCMQGLEDNGEYKAILDYLKQRGHPLFNRVRVQLLDRTVLESVSNDIREAYLAASADPTYRVKGPLCNFCPFKYLCEADCYSMDANTREQIIGQIEK